MIFEIIKAVVVVTAVIAYAVVAIDEARSERRREQRMQEQLRRERLHDMYCRWVMGRLDVEPEEKGEKHLNIICKDPSIAPVWK